VARLEAALREAPRTVEVLQRIAQVGEGRQGWAGGIKRPTQHASAGAGAPYYLNPPCPICRARRPPLIAPTHPTRPPPQINRDLMSTTMGFALFSGTDSWFFKAASCDLGTCAPAPPPPEAFWDAAAGRMGLSPAQADFAAAADVWWAGRSAGRGAWREELSAVAAGDPADAGLQEEVLAELERLQGGYRVDLVALEVLQCASVLGPVQLATACVAAWPRCALGRAGAGCGAGFRPTARPGRGGCAARPPRALQPAALQPTSRLHASCHLPPSPPPGCRC
jgi:hypothetical protein